MKHFSKIFTIIFAITLLTGACKKDDPASRRDSLLSTSWRLESIKIAGIDVTSSLVSACFLDNSYTFLDNGNLEIGNNQLKCDPNEPNITTVTWSLSSDENTLNIDGANYPIVRLHNNEIIVNETLGGQTAENRYVPY